MCLFYHSHNLCWVYFFGYISYFWSSYIFIIWLKAWSYEMRVKNLRFQRIPVEVWISKLFLLRIRSFHLSFAKIVAQDAIWRMAIHSMYVRGDWNYCALLCVYIRAYTLDTNIFIHFVFCVESINFKNAASENRKYRTLVFLILKYTNNNYK